MDLLVGNNFSRYLTKRLVLISICIVHLTCHRRQEYKCRSKLLKLEMNALDFFNWWSKV